MDRTYWMTSSSRRLDSRLERRICVHEARDDGSYEFQQLRGAGQMALGNISGALDLVPGKRLAVNRPLDRLDQHGGEKLPVREPLQPKVEQELRIFAGALHAPL